MADCDQCTGSHWLADNEALGPCVCCTPAALAELEEQIAEHQEAEAAARKTLNAALQRRSDFESDRPLADEIDDALDSAAELNALAEADAALQAYLVSIGLPSHPVTIDNPHLAELRDLLA